MTAVERFKEKQLIRGTLVRMVTNPAIALVAKAAGLDFIMFDMEHGAYSFPEIAAAAAVARSAGVGVFARVPQLEKCYVSRAVDCGVHGVMVPMIETPEMAREFVRLAKYQPVGERGLGSNGGLCDFQGMGGMSHQDFMDDQNRKTLVIAQIETRTAIENVAEIAAVPGVDVLLIGPNDLSVSMGIPGEMDNPLLLDAIEKTCREAEKNHLGFTVHGPKTLLEHWKGRMNPLMFSVELTVLTNGFKDIRKTLETL